jgi:hypothetical protein
MLLMALPEDDPSSGDAELVWAAGGAGMPGVDVRREPAQVFCPTVAPAGAL